MKVHNSPMKDGNYKSSAAGFIVIFVAFFSLFWPTSIGAVIMPHLTLSGNVLCLALLIFAAVLGWIRLNAILFVISLALMIVLFLMTFLSPYKDITFGAIAPYMTMAFVASLNIKTLRFSRGQLLFVAWTCVALCALCWSVIFGAQAVIDIQESYYQIVPDLFDYMVTWANKPVLMFATHSVAGFAYFIFSLVFYAYGQKTTSFFRKMVLYFLSFNFFILLAFLISNTGFLLFAVLIAYYLYRFVFCKGVIPSFIFVMLVFGLVAAYIEEISFVLGFAADATAEVMSSKHNGILSRFTLGSRLAGSYEYVFNSPVIGVGFTDGGKLAFGDNMLSEYVLRGGAFGYVLVLFLVFGFFYTNMKSVAAALFMFSFVLLSDLGYPLWVAFRFVFLFPVLVILLNHVAESKQPLKSKNLDE
jgi:hypothetical protein